MGTVTIVIIAFISVAVILGIVYIIIYNKIQNNTIRINEAESEIDESLRKRYDLLTQIEVYINNNTDLKQDNFKDLNKEDLRISNFEVDRKLTKITDTFSKIRQDYPDDLDTEAFRNFMIDLKINEEKNEAAKAYYNKYTTKLNSLIKKFPSNLIARIHKIDEHMYFDNKNMNDDNILDFKL